MPTRIPRAGRRRRAARWSPVKTPIQERARATVEHVITAAAQVFEEHGFAAGTTNRIAERAGVSIGTLYQYFPAKEALAVVLVERHVAAMEAALNAWVARTVSRPASLREALRSLVETALAGHEGQSRLHDMLLAQPPLPARVRALVEEAEARAADALAGVLRTFPQVRRPELRRAATLAIQATLGLTHWFIGPERGLARGAFVDETVDLLQAYLASGAPPAAPAR
ncbi:MAG TPA: TetR/AcrR family transcriptional regulator [Anaeromyxobacter sp.]|nr:TetR/AcrR family transcriptional regulator [Anaeromyxobacter sp.]